MNTPPDANSLAGRLATRLPFFYGWVIVYICFVSVFMMGATTFWGIPVFVVPMSDDTGWSHGGIFLGLAARMVVGAGAGLIVGHITDRRWGAARLLLIGVSIDSLALFSLRWVESPAQFILVYGVIGGIGNTGMRLVQSTLIAKWFVGRRGTAVGFAANGGGVSALIMVPITAFLIDQLGWRDAWGALGAIMALSLLPLVPLALRAPEDVGLLPDNGMEPTRKGGISAADERSYRLSEVIYTWQFWLLMLAALFGMYSLQTHTVVMVPYFKELGFSSGQAAAGLSVYGGFSIGLRFVWGWLADRFTVRKAIMVQAVLTAIGALILLRVGGATSLYIAMAYQGMMLSGYPPLQILLWPEFFGRTHIGSIVGLTQFFVTLAGAIGPVIAGVVYDETGSYASALWLLVVTWLGCAGLMVIVRPARHASRKAPEPA
ncbi:MAG TPA: MFS transporter [Dehalococcoidia bacterium]|nr:MFS transporter [Dehalococcoidia bacterium]